MISLREGRVVLPMAALLALGVAGCGDKTVETGSVESEIKRTAEENGLTLSEVKCPDDIKAKKGERETCEGTVEGGETLDIGIVQTDDDGNFRVEFPEEQAGGGAEEGAGDDEAIITALIEEVDKAPANICRPEISSEQFIADNFEGSREDCVTAANESGEEPETTTVESITVEGDTAVAEVEDEDGQDTVNFVKDAELGWLIESIESIE